MEAEETLKVLTRMLEICCSKASAKDVAEYNMAFENAVKAIVYYASHNDIQATADLMVRAMIAYSKEQIKEDVGKMKKK